MRHRQEELEERLQPRISKNQRELELERFQRSRVDTNPLELLEKYAILGYLVSNHFQYNFFTKKNYFEKSIFEPILGSRTSKELLGGFNHVDKAYRERFLQVHNKQLDKILFYTKPAKRLSNSLL